ncbi:hypothetical protein NCS57_00728000 [Fusarium keratoplasticum]|uniref:Uncharacterized protein n=1 Tax=Fusarium keratoplasticum TaxID=1328300 RepID=A0ACC0QXP8_9HYPO|nr:hypothetical protein NCS57_00728000 [Fusarium keratoplasticum]KAI8669140.1 hypothetical protein NCS57_00728000 [Fusarium keratoplasticum]
MSQRASIHTRVSSETQQGSTTQISSSNTENAPPLEEEIQRKPWKFIGYKGYTEFISSEDDWFVLRRFGTLNVRVALALQDEISVLEEQLKELDESYSRRESPDRHNGRFRGDAEDRRALTELISDKLYRYSEYTRTNLIDMKLMGLHELDAFVLQQSKLRRFPEAPHRDIRSIRNWHHNHDYVAIAAEEQEYLEHEKDLICLVQKDKTPLRRLIDTSLTIRTLPIWKHKGKAAAEYDAEHVSYYSDSRMDKTASVVIVAVGIVMLITPIWVLQAMDGLRAKLAVITTFVLVFLLVLSFAMASKPFEALGATAA